MEYFELIQKSYSDYSNYLLSELLNPGWHNYFYWLIGVSLFFFLLEILKPWRENQAKFRKDFWLDVFYMFFNFFLFSLIIYNAASDLIVNFFNDALASIGINNLLAFEVMSWPLWAHLLIGFVIRDFVQWWTHRLLHKVPFLWEFHKVHHSVEQMGFAAHLRYHWMETVVYRTIEYIPLALIGITLRDFFIIHIFTLAVGHYNHSNLMVPKKVLGGVFGLLMGFILSFQLIDGFGWQMQSFLSIEFAALTVASVAIGVIAFSPIIKYIFNSPEMHIWHHAYDLPKDKQTGVNFALTLSIWDYLFKTNYIPYDGKNIKLGFPGIEKFPKSFFSQAFHGFGSKERKSSDRE
ncbi:MAG: sterol desaturase family protein [Bacteroidota bacterium]